METLIIPLLVAVLVVSVLNVGIGFLLWWRHVGLVNRVTRLEAFREQNLTHTEIRQVYERLASIEGQVQTTNRLMQTVQEHLLEND